MNEEVTEGKEGTGDVDPGGGGDEDTGRHAKDEEVSSNGSSVVETGSGMKLESRSLGEEVQQDQQLRPHQLQEYQQERQQQKQRDAIAESPPVPQINEGFYDIRFVPDREDGEEECDKKVKNYALKDSGAVMLDHSSTLKGSENLLVDSRDKYSISPCDEKKQVVIALSEDIVVRAVVLGSYEKYSSLVKGFQVLGSQTYPTEEWMDLGTFTTSGALGEETFNLVQPAFARYLKFKFISHVGSEYFCTLSHIKVHGITVIESIHEGIAASDEEVKDIDKIISAVAAQETIVPNVSGDVPGEVAESNMSQHAYSVHGSVVHQEEHVAEIKQYSDNSDGSIGSSIIPDSEVQGGEPSNILYASQEAMALAAPVASSDDTGKTLEAANVGVERNVMAENVIPGSSSLGSDRNGNISQHNSDSEFSIVIKDKGGEATPPERLLPVEMPVDVRIHDPPPPLVHSENIVKNTTVNSTSVVGYEELRSIDENGGDDAAVLRSKDNSNKIPTITAGKEVAVGDGGEVLLFDTQENVNVSDLQGRDIDRQWGDKNSTATSHSVVRDHQSLLKLQLMEDLPLRRTMNETPNQKNEQQHDESEEQRTAAANAVNQYTRLDNNNVFNSPPGMDTDTLKRNLSTPSAQHWSKLRTCRDTPVFSEYKIRMMSKVAMPDPALNVLSPYTKVLIPIMEKIRNIEINSRLHELYNEKMQDCNQFYSTVLFEMNEELGNLQHEVKDLQHQLLANSTPCLRDPPFLANVVSFDSCVVGALTFVTVVFFAIVLFGARFIFVRRKKCN